jgi:hypothetical protein
MSNTEIQIIDREIAFLNTISDTEKHKSNNDKEVRLAEISMSERIAKIEIENKSHNLEQEKDFRLTNTKRLYWMIGLFFVTMLTFILFLMTFGNTDLVAPILSFVAGIGWLWIREKSLNLSNL